MSLLHSSFYLYIFQPCPHNYNCKFEDVYGCIRGSIWGLSFPFLASSTVSIWVNMSPFLHVWSFHSCLVKFLWSYSNNNLWRDATKISGNLKVKLVSRIAVGCKYCCLHYLAKFADSHMSSGYLWFSKSHKSWTRHPLKYSQNTPKYLI